MSDIREIEAESEVADKVGILVSVICCIHCMAIPFLMLAAPSVGEYFESEIIHISVLALVLPLGLYAFISKLKVHADKRPLIIGIIGMIFLSLGIISHEILGEESGHLIEMIGSIAGGLALIYAHYLNVKLCRCNSCKHS